MEKSHQDDDGTQEELHGTQLDRRPRRDMWAQLSDAMANDQQTVHR